MKTLLSFTRVFLLALHLPSLHGRAFGDIEEDIYNGMNAIRGQFPYQTLQIQQSEVNGDYAFCGGSLISTEWIMTAAHCAYEVNRTIVYVGLTNTEENTGIISYIVPKDNHYVHPQYNPIYFQNDIALLKLPSSVNTNQNVKTIALPKKAQAESSTFDNVNATASGWGQTQDSDSGIHQILQYQNIHIFPHASCVNYYKNINNVTDGMICTDKLVVYAGPCHGDSGGPLTVNGTDGAPYVIGAVSWGVGNCSSNYPVVFTNVAYYLSWINEISGIAIS